MISASEEIGLHLSRNQYQHVYKESPEEGLIQKFRVEHAKNEVQRWRYIPAVAVAKGNPSKQNDLLRMDYVWNFMEKFVPMGAQIMDRKGDMRLSPFHSRMTGPSGGVGKYKYSRIVTIF